MSKNEHKEIEAQNVTKLMNSLLGFMAFLFIGLSFAFDVRNAFIFALIFGVFIFGRLFILSFRQYVWASGGSEFTYKKFIFSWHMVFCSNNF